MESLLLQPIRIGAMECKNRMVMAPMGVTVGNMTRSTVEYFVERARGGAAMICCNIRASVRWESGEHSIVLNEETVPLFRELTERCHTYGCRVCAQIQPGDGRIGGPSLRYRVPISASACSWMHAPKIPCHELTVEEIRELELDFRETVRTAIACGADCVEIHAYGGYLTDQFLTERWNSRTDEYGGSLENRARFLKELMAICREEGGTEVPLFVKYTPDHYMEGEGFRTIEEGIALAKLLQSYGADALHVDAGCHENWYLAMPPSGIRELPVQAEAAARIRREVTVPVMTNGRLGDVERAEAVLRNGVCDLVAIGRGLLADPELPNKVKTGQTDRIRPCIACNEGCIGRVYRGLPAGCAVNPRCGHEDGSRELLPAENQQKILVVGGGPGGCMAAIYAAQAGHTVEVWETGSRLGGAARTASKLWFKTSMEPFLGYLERELLRWNIPVRYGVRVTPEQAAAYAPDHIIWAAGAKNRMPEEISGLDGPHICLAEDVLKDCCTVGQRVAVLGGGNVGVETALHLDHNGKTVVCIGRSEIPSHPGFVMNTAVLRKSMADSHVEFWDHCKIIEVRSVERSALVTAEVSGEIRTVGCDTVVVAMGGESTQEEARRLETVAPVTAIGDALRPGNILQAVETAYEAIRSL